MAEGLDKLDHRVDKRLVLVAGASNESGRAVARALTDAGARVLAVGSDLRRLAEVAAVARYECDLSSPSGVESLASRIHAEHGLVDGVVHLVGGWRAGRGDDDWAWLESRVVETLRNVSRSFFDDLIASTAGRLVMVSSTAVDAPSWSGANYTAAKAAAEAWARSAAAGFAKSGAAASVILVVKSLGDDGTPVEVLADRVVSLWDAPANELNGARLPL
jgi:NAD(P)-dependent dehydrogenase (short-subunit alcohol dehydrogenase family)